MLCDNQCHVVLLAMIVFSNDLLPLVPIKNIVILLLHILGTINLINHVGNGKCRSQASGVQP
jgi:hypothetical protein